MAEINQELVEKIIGKKKRSSKTEELKKHREVIFELRKKGLSLQDICFYLRKEHNIRVSTSTLKSTFPELENRIKRLEKLLEKMTDEELKKSYNVFRKELQKRGLLQQSNH